MGTAEELAFARQGSRLCPGGWPIWHTLEGISSSVSARALRMAVCTIALAGLTLRPAAAPPERLVLAFYYAWYDSGTWRGGKTPDLPAAPYESTDPAAMARQIEQAQSAGVDAFLLNWWGKGNPTDANLAALLDVAAGKGFRVGVDFDPNSPFMRTPGDFVGNLRYLLDTHARHPAYLSSGGRPVIFFFNPSRLGVSAWRQIREQVDPHHDSLWISEGTDLEYQTVFDGHHLYSVAWANQIPPSATLSAWGARVRRYNAQHDTAKLWVATVMPGYDDTRARAGGFVVGRRGGDYYRECWRAALTSAPDWVVINSWNEWPEGSYIEPSQAYGELFLELTREYATQFKRLAPLPVPPAPDPPRPQPTASPAIPRPTPTLPDYAVEGGWYFTQAGPAPDAGFAVTDGEDVPFWTTYFNMAGPLGLGYPISGRYRWEAFTMQDFEYGVMVWHPSWLAVEVHPAFDEDWLARRLSVLSR